MTELVPLIIDGEDFIGDEKLRFNVYDSETGEVLHCVQGADIDLVKRAADRADAGFKRWKGMNWLEKRTLLWKAGTLLEQRRNSLEKAILLECHCSLGWASMQVTVGRELLEELGGLSTLPQGIIAQSTEEGCLPLVTYEPLGVCVGMSAWNSPLALGVRALAVPLAAGNCVITKSSEICPLTHYLMTKCFVDAGFPPGTVNLIHHSRESAPEIVKELVSNPHVRKVNFTGSVEVGRIIARLAGENLKGVLLELGGKCPEIVLEDADLDKAASAAIHNTFNNNGQICMSTDRIIVVQSVAERLKQVLLSHLFSYDLEGQMISETGSKKVEELIADAESKGATVCYKHSGKPLRQGLQFNPCIIFNVTKDMRVYHEEIFGPCASIIVVPDAQAAIDVANDTAFGLSTSIFSQNISRALAAAEQIVSGAVHINSGTFHDEHTLPHGGAKDSGYGRFGSKWGIREFQHLKNVTIHGIGL